MRVVETSCDLGVEVVSSAGFSCANVQHIAHAPDWAKEKAVLELLGINAVTFWYALRENGFLGPLAGGGRLLREH